MTSQTMSSMFCGSATGASQLRIDRRWTTRRLRHDADRATHQIGNGPTAIARHAAQSPLSPMPAAPLPPTPAARTWRSTRAQICLGSTPRSSASTARRPGRRAWEVRAGRTAIRASRPIADTAMCRCRPQAAATWRGPHRQIRERAHSLPAMPAHHIRNDAVRPAGRTASTRHQVRRTVVHTTPPDSHNWPVLSHRPLGGAAAGTRHEGGAR
jgi:hypothetical protein